MSRMSSDPLSALTTSAAFSDDRDLSTGTLLPLAGGDLHEEAEPVDPVGQDGDAAARRLRRARDDTHRVADQDSLVPQAPRLAVVHVRPSCVVLSPTERLPFRFIG